MYNTRCFSVLLMLLVFVVPIFVSETLAGNSEDVAVSAIDRAEATMVSAYDAVLQAEQAGADVSDLLVRLNDAGGLLSEAHIAYGLGDFDEAVSLASLCSEMGEAIKTDAEELRLETHGPWVMRLWLTLTSSLVGVAVVVFAGFFGWGYVRKRYVRKVLEMKVEVSEGDEH